MEGFDYKAEECGLLPESDRELLEIIEKGSHEEAGVLEKECLSFVFQFGCEALMASCKMRWPCSLPLWNSPEGCPSFLFFLALSGNFPRSLGLFLQTVQNAGYCTA